MKFPSDPHLHDSLAASRYILDFFIRRKKWQETIFTPDYIGWLAQWSFHWAMKSNIYKETWL